jgi:acyl-CoA reductase-like NAD-dependent aldehyde dehydrogenase
MTIATLPAFQNLIRGKSVSMSGRQFEARSAFFPDYAVLATDSDERDLERAISMTKRGQQELAKLTFEDRERILKDASTRLKFDDADIAHCVQMMGMPWNSVKDYIKMIPFLMDGMPGTVRTMMDIIDGVPGYTHPAIPGVELKVPHDGFVYGVIPSNDPRATLFVFSFLAVAGVPAVLKVSKNELPVAYKVVQAALDAGYPKEAVSVLTWDTRDTDRATALHFKLAKEAARTVAFGSDDTIDNLLRYERKNVIDPTRLAQYQGQQVNQTLIDSLTENIVVTDLEGRLMRHTSGNCAMIVTESADPLKAAELIMQSAYHYPISCKSLKALYAVGAAHDVLLKVLPDRVKGLLVGNPMTPGVEVGYVDKELLDQTLPRMQELKGLGHADILAGGDRAGPYLASPLLVAAHNPTSDGLLNEHSMYLCTMRRCDSLAQAVDECNLAATKQPRLSVSVVTGDSPQARAEARQYETRIKADLVHVNQVTNFLHGAIHQGYNYVHALCRTRSVRR